MKKSIAVLITFFFLAQAIPALALTNEQERNYGREIFLEIAKTAPINNDPYISMYLSDIKRRLDTTTVMPFPVVLTVIDSRTVDAFATIGGYVYITTGLLATCDTEEELAGVIAHEYAHIKKRHIAKRMGKQKYLNATVVATMLAAMLAGDTARDAIMMTGLASAQTMALRYSREDEEEADREGSLIADRAGYGGLGIADFLKKLRLSGGGSLLPQYLLTHPYHEDRIINLEKIWDRQPPSVDTSFFPYLVARTTTLLTARASGLDDVWLRRYTRDNKDTVAAYGASLYYSQKGRYDESIKIARKSQSSYRDLLLGELYVAARRFPEAVKTLQHVSEPAGRYFLARAYEGMGENDMAAGILKMLTVYGPSYPEIYHRLGMILGRAGNEAAGHDNLGRYYMYKGNYTMARTNFEKAVSQYGINSRESAELLRLLDVISEKK